MKGYFFRPGDLVKHCFRPKTFGVGIIINYKYSSVLQAYDVWWVKKGLYWEYENALQLVNELSINDEITII